MKTRKRAKRARVAGAPAFEYGATRLLLDTHVWLWTQANDRRLGPIARRAIAGASEVWLSVASAWEISIKLGTGKLRLPEGANIEDELTRSGFRSLPIVLAHADAVLRLPPHHRDPFDRMLIAQALHEDLVVVTAGRHISRYDVRVLSATE